VSLSSSIARSNVRECFFTSTNEIESQSVIVLIYM